MQIGPIVYKAWISARPLPIPGIIVSTLTGELPDQTALAGVLNALYEMHLTVLSVEYLKSVIIFTD